MSRLGKEINTRVNELKSLTDLYSAPMAMSMPPYFNSSRKIIFAHNMGHAVGIVEPDMNRVYTGFEKVFGSYSEMFEKADKDWEIVDKFVRNKYNYILVLYNKKEKIYTIQERIGFEEFSEGYSTKYNNQYLDSLDIGDNIKKGDPIVKSNSFDEHNNYCFGKNLNVLYMISTSTEEDCITLMNGAEKMMDTYRVHTVRVPLTDDEVMVNIYGGKSGYKPFPLVGEKTRDGILLSVRKIQNKSVLAAGKDKQLRKLTHGDVTRYIDGKIIDINIYSNKPISKLPDSQAYEQIKELSKEQRKFYLDVYEYTSKLLANEGKDTYKCDPEVRYWNTKSAKQVDASAFFGENENPFGHIIMEFKVLQRQHLVPGSKLTGMDGNKGVVGNIFSDKFSYKTESGRPIHAILDLLGVPGRLNIGQVFKPYINYISDERRKEISNIDSNEEFMSALIDDTRDVMKNAKTPKEAFKILKEFFKIIETPDYEYFCDYFEKLKPSEQRIFIDKVVRNGIYVMQDPTLPTTIEQLEEATYKYNIKPEAIVFPDGSKSLRRAIVAEAYFIRLKQDPIDKYSARGRGNLNPITHLPARSFSRKNFTNLYSDSAVQFGTYETSLLQICNVPSAVSLLYAMLSNSLIAKQTMAKLYDEELTPELLAEIVETIHDGQRKNMEVLAARLYQLGIIMNIDMEYIDKEER